MPNKIKLSVGGIEYMVVTDDDEARVRKIGARLNEQLDKVKKGNPASFDHDGGRADGA